MGQQQQPPPPPKQGHHLLGTGREGDDRTSLGRKRQRDDNGWSGCRMGQGGQMISLSRRAIDRHRHHHLVPIEEGRMDGGGPNTAGPAKEGIFSLFVVRNPGHSPKEMQSRTHSFRH